MQQAAAVGAHRAIDHAAQIAVVLEADVLQHADRHERVERARDVPVVVLDELDAIGEPLARRALPRVGDLVRREIERLHPHAVMPRHVQRERAPSAAGLDDALARPEADLAADQIHLRDLGRLERRVGRREVRAGVEQLLVEPELVEVVAEVVVVVDVLPGCLDGVRPSDAATTPGASTGRTRGTPPRACPRDRRALRRRRTCTPRRSSARGHAPSRSARGGS